MPGSYLLETNAVIALFGSDAELVSKLAGLDEVFLATTVVGELYYGAEKSSRVAENRERIDNFAGQCIVLPADIEVASEYGRLKRRLRALGKPIPENDTWIAATAITHGLRLLTRDRHFEHVERLDVEGW